MYLKGNDGLQPQASRTRPSSGYPARMRNRHLSSGKLAGRSGAGRSWNGTARRPSSGFIRGQAQSQPFDGQYHSVLQEMDDRQATSVPNEAADERASS